MQHVKDYLDLSTGKAQCHAAWYDEGFGPYHLPRGLHSIPAALLVRQSSFLGLESDFFHRFTTT